MRRWAWRGGVAVLVMALTLGAVVGARAFSRACEGSLEGLRYLSNVRAQLASATAPAPPPRPAPTSGQAHSSPAPPAPAPETPPPTLAQPAREATGQGR